MDVSERSFESFCAHSLAQLGEEAEHLVFLHKSGVLELKEGALYLLVKDLS